MSLPGGWRMMAVAGLAVLLCGGCLVQSRCQTHADCPGDESCDEGTGRCLLECEVDEDCWRGGMPVGTVCIGHRCDFPWGERIKAPQFCLEVVNPKSSYQGQELCLAALEGKVVLLFFSLLACSYCAEAVGEIQEQLVRPLRGEGLTDFEALVITGWDQATAGPNWEDRATGYDEVELPIMTDKTGAYYIYAADYYDAVLIDKKGRLVIKQRKFSAAAFDGFRKKIRELYAE